MKKIRRAMRLLGLSLLIILASVGIGISGVIPFPTNNRKENNIEVNIENEEKEDKESQLNILDEIKG